MAAMPSHPQQPAPAQPEPPQQNKSWQARIAGATDEIAQQFVESISYDRRLYKHDIAGSIAHATMLAKVGLISDAERDAIVQGLKGIERDIESGNFQFDEAMEDIHMVVEAELIKRIGEPGRKLHTGRSRNDQVALDLTLWLRENAIGLGDQLADLQKAFVGLAERSRELVMPSFTHLQRAQPIAAGAEALAWIVMFEQDSKRLYHIGFIDSQLNDMPLGSGAIAGTSLPLDASHTRELLEFRRGPSSSIERTATRDHACEFAFACAMIAQHLSRWA